MTIVGIITEYNPFHQGHLYQIAQIKKIYPDALIIVVMSGSFTQRAMPAVLDKWTRSEHAIAGGADIIFELPFVFACRSAQDFARGAVSLLNRLGIVDILAFGAECPDLNALQNIALSIDSPDFQAKLHANIKQGKSYAEALTTASECNSDAPNILLKPNNILAIEYLRSLKLINSPIKPLIIQRHGAAYHDKKINQLNASASAIRQTIYAALTKANANIPLKMVLPADVFAQLAAALPQATLKNIEKLTAAQIPDSNNLLKPLQTLLLRNDLASLQRIYNVNEGLENRILQTSFKAHDYNELISAITTKRYPASRIARTLIYIIFNLTKQQVIEFDTAGPLYAHLLAASPAGTKFLKNIKQQAKIPLITKTSHYLTTQKRREGINFLTPLAKMLAFDTLATEFRELCLTSEALLSDFTHSPIFLSNKPQSH